MMNVNYVVGTAQADLEKCSRLMGQLMAAIMTKHPEWTLEPQAIAKDAMVHTDSYITVDMDRTPVIQYFVKDNEGNTIFDILPLLNAHAYDTMDNKWCIEAYYQLNDEDRDIIYFTQEDDFDYAISALEDYLA